MLIVENHLPGSKVHNDIDELPSYFGDANGTLIVTQPQNCSDVVLVLTSLDGKHDTDVLKMWDRMGMSPEQEVKVLREKVAGMLSRICY